MEDFKSLKKCNRLAHLLIGRKKKLIKYIMARFINVESRSVYLDT
jgi:hypothetical protein